MSDCTGIWMWWVPLANWALDFSEAQIGLGLRAVKAQNNWAQQWVYRSIKPCGLGQWVKAQTFIYFLFFFFFFFFSSGPAFLFPSFPAWLVFILDPLSLHLFCSSFFSFFSFLHISSSAEEVRRRGCKSMGVRRHSTGLAASVISGNGEKWVDAGAGLGGGL